MQFRLLQIVSWVSNVLTRAVRLTLSISPAIGIVKRGSNCLSESKPLMVATRPGDGLPSGVKIVIILKASFSAPGGKCRSMANNLA